MELIALGLFFQFHLILQYFADVVSQDVARSGMMPETTTLDWWGASTADMRAETPAEFHPKFLPQSQSQTNNDIARLQTSSNTESSSVVSRANNRQQSTISMTSPALQTTRAPTVMEIHTPQGGTKRLVEGQQNGDGIVSSGLSAGIATNQSDANSVLSQQQQMGKSSANSVIPSSFNMMTLLTCSALIYSLI